MGGQDPNLADLAVFGCLSAIEGTEAFADLQANTDVGGWFTAMKEAVQSGAGEARRKS